jgi:hypothetical protein
MKTMLLILALLMTASILQAGIVKNFPGGYIICVFDQPATITNRGSKLVVGLQDPTTHLWNPLPTADDPSSPKWPMEFVTTDNNTDEVHYDGILTIHKPVSIVFWNFKGGEVDVEFSVLPKHIKRLSDVEFSVLPKHIKRLSHQPLPH